MTQAYYVGSTTYNWKSVAPVPLVIVSCWCGMPYAIPEDLHRQMERNVNQGSYCPLGHSMVFRDGNEAEIRRLQSRLVAEQDQHDATRRSLQATKAVVTRTKRRIEKGVCIHCHRTFVNVARHMQSQHPEPLK